jgi:hypothetical protein
MKGAMNREAWVAQEMPSAPDRSRRRIKHESGADEPAKVKV